MVDSRHVSPEKPSARAEGALVGITPSELRDVERRQKAMDSSNAWSVRNRLKATLLRLPVPEKRTRADLIEITALASSACKFMAQHPLEKRVELCMNVRLETYKKGTVICKIGDVGDNFYAIITGTVALMLRITDLRDPSQAHTVGELSRDGRYVKADEITRGGGFGEMAMLSGQWNSNILAESNTEVLMIDKATYLRCFERDENNTPIIIDFLKTKVRALRNVEPSMIDAMSEYCSVAHFNKDQVFYPDEGTTINIIMQGHVKVGAPPAAELEKEAMQVSSKGIKERKIPLRDRCKHLCTLHSGYFFGESCANAELQKGWVMFANTPLKVIQISKTFYAMNLDPTLIKAINDESVFMMGYILGRINTKIGGMPLRIKSPDRKKNPQIDEPQEPLAREQYAGLFYTPPPPPPPWTGLPKKPKPQTRTRKPKGARDELTSQEKLEGLGLSLLEEVFPSRYPREIPKREQGIDALRTSMNALIVEARGIANPRPTTPQKPGTIFIPSPPISPGKSGEPATTGEEADDGEMTTTSKQSDGQQPEFSLLDISLPRGQMRRVQAEVKNNLQTYRSSAFGLDMEAEKFHASNASTGFR